MKNLKYVFYFECILMSITFILGVFFPEHFLAQLTTEKPSPAFIEFARWYGVAFFNLTFIQLATLWSGDRYALKLVMISYLFTDILQFFVTIRFAYAMGPQLTHYVSGITAIIFIFARISCYKDLNNLGIKLRN
jgi:hypothetical protein